MTFNSFPNDKIFIPFQNDKYFYSSKLKDFADDNFELDENGRKFSKQLGNTVGKGEIARYVVMSNFTFFHSVFKDLYCRHVKSRAC